MIDALSVLRNWLTAHDVDAFILPRGDRYLGEYVAPCDEMLAWLTGFTGSAGFAVMTEKSACLYTDGRYQTQGAQELKGTGFTLRHSARDKWDEDLAAEFPGGGKIAFDPWLHSIDWFRQNDSKLKVKHFHLHALAHDPINELWQDRPAPPTATAEIHPIQYAGETSASKCKRLGEKLLQENILAEVINDPTLAAWLFNLRGRDVPHIPIAQARGILYANGEAELFIAPEKISDALRGELEKHITIAAPGDLAESIAALHNKSVRLPGGQTPYALLQMAEHAKVTVDTGASVIAPARAIKNDVEIAGMRLAHQRDHNALTRLFSGLAGLSAGGMTEAELTKTIAAARAGQADYVDESFPAIVGWQGNGAIVHYRPPESGSAEIVGDGILLVDSGGQYRCGTTDITRTFAVGTPTARQREIYTRVLKGHFAIARAQFPVGTTGAQLDALARQYLWEIGLDYDHGTGHGVGSFLSVHEGPQSISNRPNTTALQPGMILSNEPGCYLPGEFGVRIENLILVAPTDRANFLKFETLTRVPYDEALIDRVLLTAQELKQLNDYQVWAKKS